MKITIKTQDIELDYEDGFSKIEATTVQNINALIEKIHQKRYRCEYCGAQSGLIVENKIKDPVVFGVPNVNMNTGTIPPKK
jgi:argininosuccinate lyase